MLVGFFALLSALPTRRQRLNCAQAEYEGREYENRPTGFFVLIIAAILIFVAGFRFYVGSDFGAYYKNYDGNFDSFFQSLIHYEEPGIRFIAWLSRLAWDDGGAVIFLAAAVTISAFIIQIYRHSKLFPVCIMLFIFIGAWHGCFNGVRQYLAAAVLIMGHRYILEKRFWLYALFVFLASLFHTTALIMILPYFLMNREINIKNMLIIIVGTIIIRYSYDTIYNLVGFYKGHEVTLNQYATSTVNILRIAVAFAPLIVYAVFCDKKGLSQEETFYINGIILNAFALFATMNSTYLARASIYTEIFPVVGYGFLLCRIREKRLRNVIIAIVLICFAAYWWYSIFISSALNNFQWIWNRT